MNTKQHISMYVERFIDALLPGGLPKYWDAGSWHLGRQLSRLFAEVAPAGLVAIHATKCPAMRNRVEFRDARKA